VQTVLMLLSVCKIPVGKAVIPRCTGGQFVKYLLAKPLFHGVQVGSL